MSEIGKRINKVIGAGLSRYLADKGFTRKGRTFHRVHCDRVDVVNVQGHRFNAGDSGQFAVNLGVFFPDVAELTDPWAPPGLPGEQHCTVRERLGALKTNGRDYWWKIRSLTDERKLSQELVECIEAHGLPWFDSNATLNAIKGRVPAITAAGICLVQGRREEAVLYVRRAYEDAPLAAERTRSWAEKHGLNEA